jgi:hypothetical protein
MSGGSYGYLYTADGYDVGGKLDMVTSMADRLEGIDPNSYAATDTREILAIAAALDYATQRLTDVWFAVEWRDSNDWSEAQMVEALAKYEARRAAEEAE